MKEVEKLLTDVLEVSKSVLGEFNTRTAGLMSNLGRTYQDMGKNSEAEELFTRTMDVQTAMLGADHDEVAKSHNFLAVLYDDNMGQYQKAEEHYMKYNTIIEKLFGPAYSELQFNYNGLIGL